MAAGGCGGDWYNSIPANENGNANQMDGQKQKVHIPLMGFAPSYAQFKYIAEWVLLVSSSMEKKMPAPLNATTNSRIAAFYRK